MDSVKKPWLWLRVAGAGMAIAAMGFLLRRIHPGALMETLRTTRPGWALAAVAVNGLLFVPAAWRWHLALRLNRCAVGFGVTLRISLIGHFFYTLLFGAAGGDVAKSMLYSRWHRQPLPEILAAASLDRLMGFGGLILFAVAAFGIALAHGGRDSLRSLSFHGAGWWLLLAPAALIALLLVARRARGETLGGKFVRAFRKSIRQLIATPRIFLPGLFCALVVQVALSSVLALNLQAVSHAPLPWLRLMWTFPVIAVISGLPVTVAGLGVRDSAAFVLLGLCGVARADAVAASLLTAAASLVWMAGGGLWLWREARQRKQKIFGEKWLTETPRPLAARKL